MTNRDKINLYARAAGYAALDLMKPALVAGAVALATKYYIKILKYADKQVAPTPAAAQVEPNAPKTIIVDTDASHN